MPSNIYLLTNFNTHCSGFAISGCYDIERFTQTGGRPDGGVGVLWRQCTNFTCTILGFIDTHRCLAVKVQGINFAFICINVYLPTFCNNDSYKDEILNCLAFIDSVFEEHASNGNTQVIVLGDFNFDNYSLGSCDRLGIVQNFLCENGLSVCDHLEFNRLEYSYHHEGLNCQSLINHVFVSLSLVNNVHNYALLETGLNFSDHYAVCFSVRCINSINGKAKFLKIIAVVSMCLLPCLLMN